MSFLEFLPGPREPFKWDNRYLATGMIEGTGGVLVIRSLTLPSISTVGGVIWWASLRPKKQGFIELRRSYLMQKTHLFYCIKIHFKLLFTLVVLVMIIITAGYRPPPCFIATSSVVSICSHTTIRYDTIFQALRINMKDLTESQINITTKCESH